MNNALRKYLREPFPFKLSGSALLVIDMQRFFLDKASHAYLPLATPIIPRIRELIDLYRTQRLPVIFTRYALKPGETAGIMARWWHDIVKDNTLPAQIIPELKPFKRDIVIRKTRYSAFAGTELDTILKKHRVERLVITGVMTHLCCETTARDGFMRDFEVFFAMDGTATDNNDLHLSSLKTLADGFAVMTTTQQILHTKN